MNKGQSVTVGRSTFFTSAWHVGVREDASVGIWKGEDVNSAGRFELHPTETFDAQDFCDRLEHTPPAAWSFQRNLREALEPEVFTGKRFHFEQARLHGPFVFAIDVCPVEDGRVKPKIGTILVDKLPLAYCSRISSPDVTTSYFAGLCNKLETLELEALLEGENVTYTVLGLMRRVDCRYFPGRHVFAPMGPNLGRAVRVVDEPCVGPKAGDFGFVDDATCGDVETWVLFQSVSADGSLGPSQWLASGWLEPLDDLKKLSVVLECMRRRVGRSDQRIIVWRGSASDLATDVAAELDESQLAVFAEEIRSILAGERRGKIKR